MKLLLFRLPLLVFFATCQACTTTPEPSTTVNHETVRKPNPEPDDHGRIIACGWWCGAPPIRVSASTTLKDETFPHAFSPDYLLDAKKETVWVEGVNGHGIGERITFSFDMTDRKPQDTDLGINSVSIINGYPETDELWQANSRVKRLHVYYDNVLVESIELADIPTYQQFDLPRYVFTTGEIHEVSFEIAEVYPGSRFEDTVLADVLFNGFGVTH
ncbi:MAG: hypothetical protein P1U85_02290 [Verrucomicrobiales bacterium]|nr:hypothetical protein [Verrucomicrobiales bacterium]